MRTRVIKKVNIKRVTEKADRQRFLYGQAVNGIMNELSVTWDEAKKILKFRMTANNIARALA